MWRKTPIIVVVSAACAILIVSTVTKQAAAQWPQWGGPDRDFTVETTGLADKWPEDGPRKLWHRELGDGYSSIVVDDGLLYTMYRVGEDEFSVALDARTGKTIWTHRNRSPFTEEMARDGPGPHSTPLIAGDHVYTIGTNAVLHCFDKKTGKVIWKHDLPAEFGAPVPWFGYGCSPLAYEKLVILPVDRTRDDDEQRTGGIDGAGQALMAFEQDTTSISVTRLWGKMSI